MGLPAINLHVLDYIAYQAECLSNWQIILIDYLCMQLSKKKDQI